MVIHLQVPRERKKILSVVGPEKKNVFPYLVEGLTNTGHTPHASTPKNKIIHVTLKDTVPGGILSSQNSRPPRTCDRDLIRKRAKMQ